MRILLDENIPIQLRDIFHGHIVASVNDRELGWKGISNGRLLSLMEGQFDLLITADRNLYAQQNLTGRTVAILVLPTNRRKEVMALGLRVATIAGYVSAGEYMVMEKTGEVQRRISE